MADYNDVPQKKVKLELPNVGLVDAVEVPVSESTEKWSEIRLEDGSLLRLKPVVISAVRVEGHYDQDGNPLYQVKANQVLVVDAPDHLRKGSSGASKEVH